MKISTRQYAKRQISWIRNKLLPAISEANEKDKDIIPFYLLDTSGKCRLFGMYGLMMAWLIRERLVKQNPPASDRNSGL
jgi:hypothetical protein